MTEETASSALHPEVNELIARLRSARDARTAAECCEALAAHIESSETKPESSRIEEAAHRTSAHPQDSELLLGVGRLYLAADLLDPAYRSLSEAVRIGAGRRGYRLLGETLLRLGDAQIAKPMLKRAISAGCSDAETRQWYEIAKAYIPMQDAKGISAVAADVKRARAQRAAAPRVPPPKPPPKVGGSAQPPSKRPGASGAWRLGWLGSRVAASDRPPPVTITPAARDLERSLPRFEIPGIPGSGRRAPDPVVPGARKPPKPPPAAERRTRTDAPVTVDLGADDEIDFDLDRDGHDVEVIAEKTGPLATAAAIPPPPPSPKAASPSPAEAKTEPAVSAVKPAPAAPGAPKLVDDRLWHSELNIRLPPPPRRPRRAKQIALGAALVVLGIGPGFVLGRFSDRFWARPVAAASTPESEAGACVSAHATATAAAKAVPAATQAPAATTEAASAKELAPPSTNARTPLNAKPLPPSKALLAVTGAPATQGLAGVAMATAADALLARARPARFAAPLASARPRATAAVPAPAPATKRR